MDNVVGNYWVHGSVTWTIYLQETNVHLKLTEEDVSEVGSAVGNTRLMYGTVRSTISKLQEIANDLHLKQAQETISRVDSVVSNN